MVSKLTYPCALLLLGLGGVLSFWCGDKGSSGEKMSGESARIPRAEKSGNRLMRTSKLESDLPESLSNRRSSVAGTSKAQPTLMPMKSRSFDRPMAFYPETFRQSLIFSMADEDLMQVIPAVSAEELEKLRHDFMAGLGADGLDPSDPEYAERWMKAELSLEDRIRCLYGWTALAAYQRERALLAHAEGARR